MAESASRSSSSSDVTSPSTKVTRLRGRTLADTCKLVYGKASELSKYEHEEKGSVTKKGHLFVGKRSIPVEEYRRHVNNLLDVFDQLGIQYATSVSQFLRKQYPDADKVLQRMKGFYTELEASTATPYKPLDEEDSDVRILLFDSATKFQTMEAVFTGNGIDEAYDDDRFQLQCEEIEILLNGGQRARDVGQEEEVKQLTQLLQGLERNGGISGPVHRGRPGSNLNTARTGGSAPTSARQPGLGSARAPVLPFYNDHPNTARGPNQGDTMRGEAGMPAMRMSGRGRPGDTITVNE